MIGCWYRISLLLLLLLSSLLSAFSATITTTGRRWGSCVNLRRRSYHVFDGWVFSIKVALSSLLKRNDGYLVCECRSVVLPKNPRAAMPQEQWDPHSVELARDGITMECHRRRPIHRMSPHPVSWEPNILGGSMWEMGDFWSLSLVLNPLLS